MHKQVIAGKDVQNSVEKYDSPHTPHIAIHVRHNNRRKIRYSMLHNKMMLTMIAIDFADFALMLYVGLFH